MKIFIEIDAGTVLSVLSVGVGVLGIALTLYFAWH